MQPAIQLLQPSDWTLVWFDTICTEKCMLTVIVWWVHICMYYTHALPVQSGCELTLLDYVCLDDCMVLYTRVSINTRYYYAANMNGWWTLLMQDCACCKPAVLPC
jgi:hypothetical protein